MLNRNTENKGSRGDCKFLIVLWINAEWMCEVVGGRGRYGAGEVSCIFQQFLIRLNYIAKIETPFSWWIHNFIKQLRQRTNPKKSFLYEMKFINIIWNQRNSWIHNSKSMSYPLFQNPNQASLYHALLKKLLDFQTVNVFFQPWDWKKTWLLLETFFH